MLLSLRGHGLLVLCLQKQAFDPALSRLLEKFFVVSMPGSLFCLLSRRLIRYMQAEDKIGEASRAMKIKMPWTARQLWFTRPRPRPDLLALLFDAKKVHDQRIGCENFHLA